MKSIILYLLSAFIFLLSHSYADELVKIQETAPCGKTFTILKGTVDNIEQGTSFVFAVKDISILARAYEVSDYYSTFRPVNETACIPFKKGDYAIINSSAESINWQMQVLDKMHPSDYQKLEEEARLIQSPYFFGFKSFFLYGAYESVSETQTPFQDPTRLGIQIEAFFGTPVLKIRGLEWEIAMRYDFENSTIKNPNIKIPTERFIGLLGANYHFTAAKVPVRNFFVSLKAGIGSSQTKSENTLLKGYSLVFPSLSFGYQKLMKDLHSYATIEFKAEAISSREKRENPSEKQASNFLNLSLGFGLRF